MKRGLGFAPMRFKPCEFLGTTHKLSVSLHTVCIQYDYASNQHGVESSKSRGPVGDLIVAMD